MALIKCPECQKEISDKAVSCPNCGCPITNQPTSEQPVVNTNPMPNNTASNNFQQSQPYTGPINTAPPQPIFQEKKKNSIIGILAFVFTIFGFALVVPAILGLILAIIDLCKKDGNKKTFSGIAIVLFVFCILYAIGSSNNNETNSTSTVNVEEHSTQEVTSPTADFESTQPIENEPETIEVIVPSESREEFIATCQEIPYKTLARNPDDYVGQRIVLTVKVTQILQGGWFDDGEYYRVYTNDEYDMWFGNEYFMYDFRVDDDTKILQDDIITVYAEFSGMAEVTRALSGTTEEVPSFKVFYMDLIAE